jgi:two-component system, sensor histidine kinase
MDRMNQSSSWDGTSTCDILVVDETPRTALAVRAAVDGLGCRLVATPSGDDALRELLGHDFALIVLCAHAPEIDGFATARLLRARERSRHVPIIFIAAHVPEGKDLLEAYSLGAVDFLSTPLQLEVLRAKAEVFVALHRRTREARRQGEQIEAFAEQEREAWHMEQRARFEAEVLKQRLEEQRSQAAELAAVHTSLAEADRRKDEFIAMLGHELRNPLAALVSGFQLQAPRAEAIGVMRRQVHHLSRRVESLLDMSRVSRGKIELHRARVRAGDILDRAIALATPLIVQLEHELSVERGAEAAELFADEMRLTQVLANLLDNAARYTDPGGHLRLTCTEDEGGVTFAVKDDGRGISGELLPNVFDLFVQERTGVGGLGIGLTLARQLVKMHDGHIVGRSDGPGRGSVFAIWLPPCPDEVGVEPAAVTPRSAVQRALRITLVDDNDDARAVLGELLETWGHRVSHANTGAAGVRAINEQHADVALIDIGLPDMDGYDVARQVVGAAAAERPLLVALSGFGRAEDRERAHRAGFDHHLTKPASSADLKSVLAEAEQHQHGASPAPARVSASG